MTGLESARAGGGQPPRLWYVGLPVVLALVAAVWWYSASSVDRQERSVLLALESARTVWVEASLENVELTAQLLASQADLVRLSSLPDAQRPSLDRWLAESLFAHGLLGGCLIGPSGELLAFAGRDLQASQADLCHLERTQLEQSARGEPASSLRVLEKTAYFAAIAPVVQNFDLRGVLAVVRGVDVNALFAVGSGTLGQLLVVVDSAGSRQAAGSRSLPESAVTEISRLLEAGSPDLVSTVEVSGSRFRVRRSPWQEAGSARLRWVGLTPLMARGLFQPLVQVTSLIGILGLVSSLGLGLRNRHREIRRADQLSRDIARLSGVGEPSGFIREPSGFIREPSGFMGGSWKRPRWVVSEVAIRIEGRRALRDAVLETTKTLGPPVGLGHRPALFPASGVPAGALLRMEWCNGAAGDLAPGCDLERFSVVAGAGGEVRGMVGRGWWARFEGSDGAYRALLAAAEVDCRSCGRSADVVAAITLGEDELQLQDLERLVGKAEPGELVLSSAVAKLLTATLTRAGIEIEDRRGTRSGSGSGAVLAPPWSRIVRQAAALVALEPSEESSPSRLPDFLAGSSITARYLLVGLPTAKGLWVQCVARDLVEPSTVVLGWLKTPVWSDSVEDERLGRALERSRWLRHPNIAQLVNVLRVGGDLFTVSEWVSGPTLRQVLDTVGPMSQATALELARTLCSALSAAHRIGICHHDLCPENVVFEPSGVAKIVGLGVAPPRLRQRGRSEDGGLLVRAAAYLAPEQLEGPLPASSSDLYSLGVLLFEAVSGRCPFEAPTTQEILAQHLAGTPPSLRASASGVSPEFDDVVLRCLEKDPSDRFAGAAALGQRLDQVRRSMAQSRRSPSVSGSGGAGVGD